MYREHFGFQSPPFEDRLAQDGEIFIGARQRIALANLKIALGARDAAIVLTGAPGVGKTTLGSHALRTTTTRLALAWIGLAPLTGHELLEHLLTEFGCSPYKCSRVERLQMWRQFLNEMSLTETRVGILVEKAESVSVDVLQTLDSLTSAGPSCPGANVILTGDPALRQVLRAPELEGLRQRIRLSQTVDALGADELTAFLDYKIAAAGGEHDVFAPGAVAMLHRFSEGRIRVAKNLCDTVLTIAALRKEAQLTPRLIAQVAVGLLGLEPPEPLQPPRASDAEQHASAPVAQQPQADSEVEPQADSSETHEQPDDAALELDVPTLTDSVEIAPDPLLEDIAASESAAVENRYAAPSEEADGGVDVEPADTEDPDDTDESDDPELEALQAFANAKALEDISNSMAETLFGDAELAQLGATLALAGDGEYAGALEGRRAAPTSQQDGDEAPAASGAGGAVPRFA